MSLRHWAPTRKFFAQLEPDSVRIERREYLDSTASGGWLRLVFEICPASESRGHADCIDVELQAGQSVDASVRK